MCTISTFFKELFIVPSILSSCTRTCIVRCMLLVLCNEYGLIKVFYSFCKNVTIHDCTCTHLCNCVSAFGNVHVHVHVLNACIKYVEYTYNRTKISMASSFIVNLLPCRVFCWMFYISERTARVACRTQHVRPLGAICYRIQPLSDHLSEN